MNFRHGFLLAVVLGLSLLQVEGLHDTALQRTGAHTSQSVLQQNFDTFSVSVETTKGGNETFGGENKIDEVADEFKSLPKWAQIIICIIGIIIGLLLLLVGYKFFKVSVFLVCGFTVGLLLYGILEVTIDNDFSNKTAVIWGVSIAAAILAGILFCCLVRVGVFFLGACFGIFLAILLNPIALRYIWPEEPVINLYIWMAVFGIIFGFLTLCIETPLMIVSTSFTGSFLIILSIGGLAGNFPHYNEATKYAIDEIPWEWWAYTAGWVVLFTLGTIVQFLKTAKHEDHRKEEHYQRL